MSRVQRINEDMTHCARRCGARRTMSKFEGQGPVKILYGRYKCSVSAENRIMRWALLGHEVMMVEDEDRLNSAGLRKPLMEPKISQHFWYSANCHEFDVRCRAGFSDGCLQGSLSTQ